jgi:nucleolar protein 9
MPREVRKRGRRAEKQRKEEKAAEEPTPAPAAEFENLYIEDHEGVVPHGDDVTIFFGLLSEEEQEYFKRADEMLSLDEFGDADGASTAKEGCAQREDADCVGCRKSTVYWEPLP